MPIRLPLKRKILSLLVLLSLVFPLSAGKPRAVIETGPTGAAAFSTVDRRTGFTFTGGENGMLRVWNTEGGNLVYSSRLSRRPLRMAVVHPKKPEIAVITSDGLNSFVLTVWDWQKEKKKGFYKLPELPLFLKYSPQGNFLVYGITEWRSLTFLDTASGAVLPYLTDGFGIVSNALISGSGETILTYGPSGSLQYWSIPKGKLKKKISTLANLSHINFTPSGRYMIAAKDQKILLVDLISGAPRQTLDLPSIRHMKLDPTGKTLVAYSKENSGFRLSVYKISGPALSQSLSYANLGIRRIDTLLPLEKTILMTLPSGEIKRFFLADERLETFASSTLRRIVDVAATSRTLLLGTSKELIALDTDIFFRKTLLTAEGLKPEPKKIPFSGPPRGISVYGEDLFLLYTKEEAPGSLALFSPEEGTLTLHTDYPYAFTAVDIMGTKIATLDRKGDIRITDMETGEIGFHYSSFGIQTLAFIGETTLAAGRRRNSTISSPLLHLNTVTGETMSIADTNLLTFHLHFDASARKLYSLGIEEGRNKVRTVLKSHGGNEFEKVETLSAVAGENLDASMLIEQGGGADIYLHRRPRA